MLILGKKEYALESKLGKWEPHAKGVPHAERLRYLLQGSATFSRPTRLREAARDGSVPNVWRKRTKQRRTDLRKTASPVDGSLPAPWIYQGDVTKIHA